MDNTSPTDKIDNKNMTIVELLLEIARLRGILKKHGIDYKRRSKTQKNIT